MISAFSRRVLRPKFTSSARRSVYSFHGNDIENKGSSIGSLETEDWFIFPRETEGNIYTVNWSLVIEGVTPTKQAYRDARIALITSKLPVKPSAGKVELTSPSYFGNYKLQEAGDTTLSLEEFSELSVAHKKDLSFQENLFVEDAALGSFSCVRVGVRVVSDDPAYALISRALLIPIPPRVCNHMARFNGWNFDPRWQTGVPEKQWVGDKYLVTDSPPAKQGLRPIVVFVGGDSDKLAVEFIQNDNKIVGADVIVGKKVPVRGVIDAIGHAAVVLVNEQQSQSLALASASFTKGKSTCVVIGADDSVVDALYASKSLYGAYTNILTSDGVSACWNGLVGTAAASSTPAPSVVVGGKSANALSPDNLAPAATHIVFFEKGGKKTQIKEEEALKKIIALVGDSKAELAGKLIKGAQLFTAGSAAEVSSIL